MHHLPSRPSLSTRLAASLRRRAALLSGAGVCAAVALVVLGVLLFSGGAGPADVPLTVDASSETGPAGADLQRGAVRLGVDGAPATAGSPAGPTDGTADTAPERTPPGTTARGTPGTTDPGTTDPGTTDPGTTDPGPAPGNATAGSPAPGGDPAGTTAPDPGGTAPPGTATPKGGSTGISVAPPAVVPIDPGPPPATPVAAPPVTAGTAEDQVLALVNRERAAAGCASVTADGGLAAVARAHSADMRDRGFFDHTNPDQLDPFERAAAAGLSARAENIARGQADAAAAMAAWMNSPGHRANILDCGLTRLGVGVAEGAGGPWWTQVFA